MNCAKYALLGLASLVSLLAPSLTVAQPAAAQCSGSQIQVNFGGAYPDANYWPQTQFSFPHSSASNASTDVDFSMQWTAASGAPPLTHTMMQASTVPLPDGTSSPSPWFVIARVNANVAGTVGTLRYAFSKPVGDVGFAVGSIDAGGLAESVTVNLTLADGTSMPLTNAVPYATPPLAPTAWPSQPTVYYGSAGDSNTGGVFTGNGQIYIAIPQSTPVTAIDVTYTIVNNTTGGIGFTPPTFLQCNPPVPVLADDFRTVSRTQPTAIDVLTNDQAGVTLDTTYALTLSDPAAGTLSYAGSQIQFTPTSSFTAPVTFLYQACNAQGGCATAKVTLTPEAVTPVVASAKPVPALAPGGLALLAFLIGSIAFWRRRRSS